MNRITHDIMTREHLFSTGVMTLIVAIYCYATGDPTGLLLSSRQGPQPAE